MISSESESGVKASLENFKPSRPHETAGSKGEERICRAY